MADELSVAEIQIVKEALDKLGITEDIIDRQSGKAKPPEERVDEYAKHFVRLYKGIRQRFH